MTSSARVSDQTAIPAVLVGTAAWLIALVVLTITVGVDVPATGVWWWGVSAVGSVSGLIGLVFVRWRRSRLISGGNLN
jgi:hypothetical protein